MNKVREEIAKNVSFYRKKLNITQKELAEKLNLKSSSVSNWETGINSVDIDTLHKICKIFNISMNDMFGCFSNEYKTCSIDKMEINLLDISEKELLNMYRQINKDGQETILKHLELIANSTQYKKCNIIGLDKKEA